MNESLQGLVLTRGELATRARKWRREGKRIVFTNGVFDVLHRGHIDLLKQAHLWGDVLVVGMNSDASTRRLKGPTRPINKAKDRAAVLCSLRSVDAVSVFPEDTPLKLILALRPNILVKGGEYAEEDIVGATEVRSWGGMVKRFRMRPGLSSTKIIRGGRLAGHN